MKLISKRTLCRFICRIKGYKKATYGKCSVYGTSSFLASFRSAVLLLKNIDVKIVDNLISETWIFTLSDDTPILNFEDRIYGISKAWLAWKEEGIATNIVQSYMSVEFNDDISSGRVDNLAARRGSLEWLKKHNFPEPIVNTIS